MPTTEPPRQLQMIRPHLDALPALQLHPEYSLRCYGSGDEAAWAAIMNDCIGSDWTAERCRTELIERPGFRADGLYFAVKGDEVVGTACAWVSPPGQGDVADVHMVGVSPEHRGHNLGYAVTLAALWWMNEHGFKRAHLSTDDWRLPAIETYLRLGFEPVLYDRAHRDRWARVYEQLGRDVPWDRS